MIYLNFKSLTDSFNYAIEGFIDAVRTQRNMKIHVVTAILIFLASILFNISKMEFIVVALSVTLVISAELFNTAIESAVDATTNHYHPLVKVAKNTAAAGVLITAVNAVVVGYLIFWDKITDFTYRGFTILKNSSPYLPAGVLAIVFFIVIMLKATLGEGTPIRGGMPSGHTAVAFSLSAMMGYISQNHVILTLSFILALIVAQSRVDSRIHTFLEVIVGALVGLFTTVLIFRLLGF